METELTEMSGGGAQWASPACLALCPVWRDSGLEAGGAAVVPPPHSAHVVC